MGPFVQAFVQTFLELAPWLLLGTAIAGALHAFTPADLVRRHLGGRFGVIKAVALGVPMPLCSCGVIPAGVSLRKDGASRGASLGFIISTPQTGVDSILVSAAFLGLPFALFKVFAAFVTGIVGGAIANVAEPEPQPKASSKRQPVPGLAAGFAHATEVLRSIALYIVVGVVASAAIQVFVPTEVFASIAGYGVLATAGAALAVSVPMYVCATASVPVAAALIAGGLPTSAAMVFLMAGPATNLATIGAVRDALGTRSLIIYLVTVIVGATGFGFLFDEFFTLSVAGHAHTHQMVPRWLELLSAGVLALMLLSFMADSIRQKLQRAPEQVDVELDLAGLTCGGCVRSLDTALRALPGVEDVEVTKTTARITGMVPRRQLESVVQAKGFQVVAPDP